MLNTTMGGRGRPLRKIQTMENPTGRTNLVSSTISCKGRTHQSKTNKILYDIYEAIGNLNTQWLLVDIGIIINIFK